MTTLTSTHCGVHQLVADVTLLNENRVLMIRTNNGPPPEGHDGWYLPDDYVGDLEHPDDAAHRILEEQADTSSEYVKLSHIDSYVAGDGAWNLAFHYIAHVSIVGEIDSDDTQEIRWFDLGALPESSEVANFGQPLAVIARAAISATDQPKIDELSTQ